MSPRTVFLLVVLVSTAIAQNSSESEWQQQPPTPRAVDFKTPDGIVLKGTYFAAGKPGPGVILYHQSNRTRESWSAVAGQLAAAGINVLAMDSRAHGESGGKSENRGGGARKTLWPQDLDTAFEALVSQAGVDRKIVGIGGAGALGVDNSVETARRHPEVKSLVLISGETLLPQLQFLRESPKLPGLFIVSDDDEYPPTSEAMESLYVSSASPSKQLIHYVGPKAPWIWYEPFDIGKVPATGSHGTDLFSRHADLPEAIVRWFVNTLIKTPGHAPADAVASAAILNEIESPGGIGRVTERLLEARKQDPQSQLFPEVNVDIIAEDHQREGDNKIALEIFKLNLLAYPDSADANGNLADAYLRDGQKDLARKYVQKAFALLDSHAAPASSWSDTQQRRSEIRKGLEDVLKKLKDSR
jgi:dienelactone hydrolase